jgi:formate C-acetyltransferase
LSDRVSQLLARATETLRKAQANPEQYRSLLVRVWGFSAYFTTLTKEYQEEIIARTAHGLP